ncbi:hypothetical protein [Shewanella pealeana]|uniref:Uncharacterized protein n=1 Tax=Shewanella pealeana (strain ATCC 700345 / ANG-SQ1) TaxID=398579 RepID=A8GZR3_SHEPA|nr:hypothetical protein [Shewanella pealeana]ABV85800.1 conserved hypothetical protein [Shewanella pealeana ATCC 700345]
MRRSVKYRLLFLLSAIMIYCAGFQWLPESMEAGNALGLTIAATIGYFVLLPAIYAYSIIHVGQQKWWKMIVILSLSSLMARLSFPAELASYFEFIAWLRYPIIAVLLVIELYLMVSIVKGLWQARSLKGDPRLHIIDKYRGEDEKKQTLALVLASEPASWYYAIPWFSRNHSNILANINLYSAKLWHWFLLITAALCVSALSYIVIASWSELVALIVSSILAYSLVAVTANYRISRHFSVYIQDNKLVLNNSMWGFLAVKLDDIESIKQGKWAKTLANKGNSTQSDMLIFGRGKTANILLTFKQPQTYFGALGQLPEKVEKIYLVVDTPKELQQHLHPLLSAQAFSTEELSKEASSDDSEKERLNKAS